MRIYVCSPLRGPDGQPSDRNIKLARKLMRAVFDAGHAPFAPHLLYPQVLSESPKDLAAAFAANYAFLDVCDEIWVYASGPDTCSKGMHAEVMYVLAAQLEHGLEAAPRIWYMPPAFAAVKEDFEYELLNTTQRIAHCDKCSTYTGLNSQNLCLRCFAGGTPA